MRSNNRPRGRRVTAKESVASAVQFGEGNSNGQVWGGKVPSFPPVSIGGVLRLKALTIKESLGFLGHPTRQHDTLAWGGWTEGLGGFVFLAGGSMPRATAVGEGEELQTAEGTVQLALGKQVSREQAPWLGLWLPILWLEHIILQLLHTLGRLHLPCQGAMQASRMLPPPTPNLEDSPSPSFFPAFPSYPGKLGQVLVIKHCQG